MIELPNGNRCSELTVTPSTWQDKKKFDPKKDWQINLRFYPKVGKSEQKPVRGMNHIKTWKERRDLTEVLMERLEGDLREGYNPITNLTVNPNGTGEIGDNSLLVDALNYGLKRAQKRISESAFEDAGVVVRFIQNNVDTSDMRVKNLSRKQLLELLDRIEAAKIRVTQVVENGKVFKHGQFSNNNYNHFRKYLGIILSELFQKEIITDNPVNKDLKKRKTIRKRQQTLTPEERELIREKIPKPYPELYRYIQILFHSGSRHAELFRLKGKDVNLKEQTFIVLLGKGRDQWEEVEKVIKNVALPYWIDIMKDCGKEDYVFSTEMKSGPVKVNPAAATKKWREHIKKKLGITANIYALKNLHTDEVAIQLSLEAAQKHNNHSTLSMTEQYAPDIKKRRAEKIKDVNNEF